MMIAHYTENGSNLLCGNITDNSVSDIQETRLRICKTILIAIAIIAIPALAASLYRIIDVGGQPIMGVHIILTMLLWIVVLFRNKIPYNYQAGFIVFVFLIIGLGGISQFGLVAAGTVFLVTASPIAALFFGGRVGIATLILSFCGAVTIGLLTVLGKVKYGFDVNTYVAAPSSWINSIICWGLTSTALTISVHVFNKKLIDALKLSRQHQKDLYRHKLSLERTIEERNRINSDLQKALEEIKTLRGILPICCYCHSIRDDNGAWSRIEDYLSAHSDIKLTHGICPKCKNKVLSDAGLDINEKEKDNG